MSLFSEDFWEEQEVAVINSQESNCVQDNVILEIEKDVDAGRAYALYGRGESVYFNHHERIYFVRDYHGRALCETNLIEGKSKVSDLVEDNDDSISIVKWDDDHLVFCEGPNLVVYTLSKNSRKIICDLGSELHHGLFGGSFEAFRIVKISEEYICCMYSPGDIGLVFINSTFEGHIEGKRSLTASGTFDRESHMVCSELHEFTVYVSISNDIYDLRNISQFRKHPSIHRVNFNVVNTSERSMEPKNIQIINEKGYHMNFEPRVFITYVENSIEFLVSCSERLNILSIHNCETMETEQLIRTIQLMKDSPKKDPQKNVFACLNQPIETI